MRFPLTNRRRLPGQIAVGLTVAAVVAPRASAFRAGHGASGDAPQTSRPTRPTGGQTEADGFAAIYRDMLRPGAERRATSFTVNTTPEAVAGPAEQLPAGEPGFGWGNAGIGIALGAVAGVFVAAMLAGRRRGTLDGS